MISSDWQASARHHYLQGDYARAADLYAQAIANQPDEPAYYWYLGLLLLLQDQGAEAQATWLLSMLEQPPERVEQLNHDLVQVLEQAAWEQEDLQQPRQAYWIRQQLRELYPQQANNLLHELRLALETSQYHRNDLSEVLPCLANSPSVDFALALAVLQRLLERDPLQPDLATLVAIAVHWAETEEQRDRLRELVLSAALEIGYFLPKPAVAANLCEAVLPAAPENPDLIYYLSCFCQDADRYEEGIQFARQYLALTTNLPQRIAASKNLLKALLVTGGHWQEAVTAFEQHRQLLAEIVARQPLDLDPIQVSRLFNAYFFAPYLRDRATDNRRLQNQLAALCQENFWQQARQRIERHYARHRDRRSQPRQQPKLRIGYLSYCLKSHSVGWLARSLIQHHDREQFEIYLYLVAKPESSNPLQDWYISQADKATKLPHCEGIVDAIFQDEIDLLVELDSITLDITCSIIALKPAPVQVTWLGWDASGIPAIDYFIADPYVLPEAAESYYRESIYRLPRTYIAVDGFEVGTPTLRRDTLGIPTDAVLYYSVQKGYKRHPETMRLQLKIIKAVPNSYFLIKGSSDTQAMQDAFYQLAREEGVEPHRLRFLDVDLTEATHRANLGIADVVLDTYPYNGATTTMETLWMGIPLVTWVGQQFSARNSYTMLVNAGVEAGIARNADEYVEWGIRFGTDANLRQSVHWQLHQAKRTAPLWNGRQFARDMESAYRTMWQQYL